MNAIPNATDLDRADVVRRLLRDVKHLDGPDRMTALLTAIAVIIVDLRMPESADAECVVMIAAQIGTRLKLLREMLALPRDAAAAA